PAANRHLHSFPTRRSSDLIAKVRKGWRESEPAGGAPLESRRVAFTIRTSPAATLTGVNWSSRIVAGANQMAAEIRIVAAPVHPGDRKSTRLNSSHVSISYA